MNRSSHPAAKLPTRSSVREEGLPLERAVRSLEDMRQSLKLFAKTASVVGDPALGESVRSAREKLKKVRKALEVVSNHWAEKSAY